MALRFGQRIKSSTLQGICKRGYPAIFHTFLIFISGKYHWSVNMVAVCTLQRYTLNLPANTPQNLSGVGG